jgi:hypothetical protein
MSGMFTTDNQNQFVFPSQINTHVQYDKDHQMDTGARQRVAAADRIGDGWFQSEGCNANDLVGKV